MILVPVSLGELIDKITILKIKLSKMTDKKKLENVDNEYKQLSEILKKNNFTEENKLFKDLYNLNLEFWEYHDYQREKWISLGNNENIIDIELYKRNKNEHILNDKRAEIKKRINLEYDSSIVEEKQFISYQI
jgi:hypothetical protein